MFYKFYKMDSGASIIQTVILYLQVLLFGLKYNHISIALEDEERTKGKKLYKCYDIVFGTTPKKVMRETMNCDEYISMYVTRDEYKRIMNYLENEVSKKTDYNYKAYFWNYFPFIRNYPIKGSGLLCFQLILYSLVSARILNLNGIRTYCLKIEDVKRLIYNRCSNRLLGPNDFDIVVKQ